MKKYIIIFKKEFIGIIRDKRTIITMIVIPILLFPILLNLTGSIASNQIKNEQEKKLSVGIIGENYGNIIVKRIANLKEIKVSYYKDISQTDTLIKTGKLDGALFIEKDFDSRVKGLQTGNLVLFYKSQNWGVKDRLMRVIDLYKNALTQERLTQLKITNETIDPIEVKIQDISTKREILGQTIGGIIPYIFVIFAFMGCIYPAIDLFTNEKEKGTLETILASPAGRLEILFAKMSVVACIGFSSALLSIVGLSFGLHNLTNTLPPEVMQTMFSFIRPENILMMLSMLLPLTVFFASALTLVTTYAKSYKEAQSIITPVTFLVILPAVVGIMPGITLNLKTAIIPVTNISLATKEIIGGTINPLLFILVLVSLLIYAALGVFASSLWFSKESNIVK
jgi:sodium transport system permease protein